MVGRVYMGRYRATRLIGEGGMGRVYLATQIDTGRQVVVKVLNEQVAAREQLAESLQQEVLFMARFRHPYAVALFDASFDDPGGPCIVMEYIPGVTLDALLHHYGRLTPLRLGRLLGQLCLALQAAHDQAIIHRDLKPANLMVVDPDTPNEKIKVMDFGLAKLSNAVYIPLERLSSPETFFSACGTPEYIAPEQVRGDEVDHRSDLYSVGAILYEALTGQVPFSKPTIERTLLAHVHEKVPAFPKTLGPGVPPIPAAIEEVVRRCLAKYPNERPQSARELAEEYGHALGVRIYRPEDCAAAAMNITPPPALAAAVRRSTEAPIDPNAIVHQLEAWMPERIAVVKLKGFVDDVGGQLVESTPGKLRVRLPAGQESAKTGSGIGLLSAFGLGSRSAASRAPGTQVELRMEKRDGGHQSRLHITVILKPEAGRSQAADPIWRRRCDEIHRELKAYLMG